MVSLKVIPKSIPTLNFILRNKFEGRRKFFKRETILSFVRRLAGEVEYGQLCVPDSERLRRMLPHGIIPCTRNGLNARHAN